MPKTILARVTTLLAIVVLAGWVWAFSNTGMPDGLWLLNVVLTVVTLALIVYLLVQRRRRPGTM